MESILLIGACSAVDVLGKMLTSCSCFQRSTSSPGGIWDKRAGTDIENASVAPVCDNSFPSSDSSLVERSMQFSQISTINVAHRSPCPDSVVTISSPSICSIDDNEVSCDYYNRSTTTPMNIKTFCSSLGDEFIEVKLGDSINSTKSFTISAHEPQPRRRQSRQHYQSTDRDSQRHRFLGHTTRKRRVRQLLTKELKENLIKNDSGILSDSHRSIENPHF